jgi:plasmid stabilization system protein ParE
MALELRWSRLAVSDVRSIFTYIDQFQPSAARRVVNDIESRVTALATSPFIGRRSEALVDGREFVVSGTP